MWFCKRDIIPNKMKNDGSDSVCKYRHRFLAKNNTPNYIAIVFPEEIRRCS